MTATTLRLRYLIILGLCLHSRFSHASPCGLRPYDDVKIVTYGEPCHSPCYLPVKIEAPVLPMEERVPLKLYQPLNLNYQTSEPILPKPVHVHREYPVSVEVPKVTLPLEVFTPDLLRGKSYGYNIQVPPPPCEPTTTSYDFDVQIPPSPTIATEQKPVKLLTGLTGKIDRILVPACDRPSCNCGTYNN